ncbi:MAG: hypothetical protein HY762_03790 [Planctomycetes bacterium]|nr:hypothetical protein [Planctomycetota bacterium]
MRVPFLDHRLVEFIFSLPANYKISDGLTKWVLRQAMKGILPDAVRNRRDKIGFGTPEVNWLKENKKTITDLFNNTSLSNDFVNPKSVIDMIESTLSDDLPRITNLWKWINLELWLRVFWGK